MYSLTLGSLYATGESDCTPLNEPEAAYRATNTTSGKQKAPLLTDTKS